MRRWEHFDYEERDGVATVTFSRPDRLNSLTFDVYAGIRNLTDSLRRRQDIHMLVIQSQNRGFCSDEDVDQIIAELVKMRVNGGSPFRDGEQIRVRFDPNRLHLFERDSGKRIEVEADSRMTRSMP